MKEELSCWHDGINRNYIS